jgi:hypothetical protein
LAWKATEFATGGYQGLSLEIEFLSFVFLAFFLILTGWVSKRRIEDKSRARFL